MFYPIQKKYMYPHNPLFKPRIVACTKVFASVLVALAFGVERQYSSLFLVDYSHAKAHCFTIGFVEGMIWLKH